MGDATDFHIDLVARFAPSGAILASSAAELSDPRASYMERHLSELRTAVNERGKRFDVVRLPAPHMVSTSAITFSGTIKPVPPGSPTDASYSNYLVTNGVVVVPVYGRLEDQEAISILREHFPDRSVVGVSAISLSEQGGAIHCLTQQQPVGPCVSVVRPF
jgi:agmatine deiminase